MADILVTATNTLTLGHVPNHQVKVTGECYGTLNQADRYFDNRLRNEPWKHATRDERNAALAEATRIIDRFNYVDDKASEEQGLQFPRTGDTEVPLHIELACYEIAIKLVDGYDPDIEQDVLAASSQGFGGVRQTYDRTFIVDHIRAGVPSATAWGYLYPYFRDSKTLNISRVN